MNKGVISSSRLSSLDRDLASAQGNLLDLEIALTRARQTVSESERDKTGIVNQRNAENQQQLNTIEASLSRTSIDMQVAQMLGQQAGYDEQLSRMQAAADEAPANQRLFTITRRNGDGTTSTFPANGTTLLQPHDMLDIGGADAVDGTTGGAVSAVPANAPHLALDMGAAPARRLKARCRASHPFLFNSEEGRPMRERQLCFKVRATDCSRPRMPLVTELGSS